MLPCLCAVLLCISLFQVDLYGESLIDPVHYPCGTIQGARPCVFWRDIYTARDRNVNVRYRLTVQREQECGTAPMVYTFMPSLYYRSIYLWRIPATLRDGVYRYTIERVLDGNSMESRHYHFLRYPIRKRFTVDSSVENVRDELRPEYLVQYMYIERNNTLINGYNAVFFGTAGTVTLGIGILFYTVIDFGIWSTVIAAVCFASSAAGYSATGYYTWQYAKMKRKLHNIIEIGKRTTLQGGVIDNAVHGGVELSF